MDRDFTVDAGLAYSYAFGTGTIVQARLLQEITGEHDGQEIDLQLRQNLMDFGLPFGIMAGARWESADLANYLYGVRAAEAIVGRPAYAPGDSIVPYIGIGTRIPLGDRFSISGGVRAEFYGSDVTNSPIVEDDMAITGTLGLTLRF
jgi:outer membrane protein